MTPSAVLHDRRLLKALPVLILAGVSICGNVPYNFLFGPCIFIIEGRTDQRNAQINLLLFKLLRHVSAT